MSDETFNAESSFCRLRDIVKLVLMDNLKYGTLRGAMIDLLKDPFEVTTQNEVIDDMVK